MGVVTRSLTPKLAGNGTIKAKEVIVSEDTGADFVFDENYSLIGLQELEKWIKSNNRLPAFHLLMR